MTANTATFDSSILGMLACPRCHGALAADSETLSCDGEGGPHRFAVSPAGIPQFAAEFCSPDAQRQQAHFDRVAAAYVAQMGYAHTREYMAYLDRVYFECLPEDARGGLTAELCCGHGESIQLLGDRYETWIGVDVSGRMLEAARRALSAELVLVQGDATMLPFGDGLFDHVVMLGGIHHVPDRRKLFEEVHRVLKPGGVFSFREPASDLWLWRALRAVIYKLSPGLDEETERPLLRAETVPVLEAAGFAVESWRTAGFLAYCFLMNSDILVFNRLFRFIPGIRLLTRFGAWIDERTVRLPGLRGAGLQVVGIARKPADA